MLLIILSILKYIKFKKNQNPVCKAKVEQLPVSVGRLERSLLIHTPPPMPLTYLSAPRCPWEPLVLKEHI